MHTQDKENLTNSQDLNRSSVEPIESIEHILRERGFFDSVQPETKG